MLEAVFSVEVRTEGFWGVGSGLGLAGLVDRLIQKDSEGYPFIPAATFKGVVRDNFTALAQQELGGLRACSGRDACPRCQIFGSPANKGQFYFSNLQIVKHMPLPLGRVHGEQLVAIRQHNKISRLSGRAADDHLFASEQAKAGLTFNGAVEGWLEDGQAEQAVALLWLSILAVNQVGGWRSRGYGRVTTKAGLKMGDLSIDMEDRDRANDFIRKALSA